MLDIIDIFLQKIKYICVKYRALIIIGIIILVIMFSVNYMKNDSKIDNIKDYYNNELQKVSNKEEKNDNNEICVYITGQIENPGIYYVKEGSRYNDIIRLAGGITDEANIENINLAKKVSDGEKIYIYAMGEEIKNNELEEESNGKVNINLADINQLKTLTGIGDSTANKIVNYRQKNGNFKSIEEIKKVSGIGDSKFDAIKNDISI